MSNKSICAFPPTQNYFHRDDPRKAKSKPEVLFDKFSVYFASSWYYIVGLIIFFLAIHLALAFYQGAFPIG
jgi:hypothetical protein